MQRLPQTELSDLQCFQYIYELKSWRDRPAITWGSQMNFENQSDVFKQLWFSSFGGNANACICGNDLSVYLWTVQLCRTAADWDTASQLSAAQAALSQWLQRITGVCQTGVFMDSWINSLVRNKVFSFSIFQGDGEGRHWRETLCFQVSWCGDPPDQTRPGSIFF